MSLRLALLALGALYACNASAAGPFTVYFNDSSSCTSASNAGNALLSNGTGGPNNPGNPGDLVISPAPSSQLSFAGCGTTGGQQLTFGPAQPLQGPSAPLAAGSNVNGSFSILPLNAQSCTATFTGTGAPPATNVCGVGATPSCTSTAPITFSAAFTNTGTNATAYQASVNCQGAAGASPATLQSNTVSVTQNGNSGGTPTAAFTCAQTSSLTITCTDQSTDPGSSIGSWAWTFGDSTTSTQKNPTHTYASANTYTVGLTVTDSVNASNTSTTSKPVTVTTSSATACTTGQAGDMPGYTALCYGPMSLYSPNKTTLGPSPFTYDFVFGAAWPGAYAGLSSQITMSQTQFLSIPFVAAPGHTIVTGVNTTHMPNNNAMFSVSTQPGLFNNGVANGTTVLCVQGRNPSLTISSNNYASASCKLNTTSTYWLNMVPGLIPPGGGSFVPCSKTPCSIAVSTTGQIN